MVILWFLITNLNEAFGNLKPQVPAKRRIKNFHPTVFIPWNPKTWTTHKPKFYTILGFQGIKTVGWKFLIRRLAGTWGFKFPKASFKFVIRNQRITIGRRTLKLRPSKN
jgi:hypothetical protein